jgi:hypothetical protein
MFANIFVTNKRHQEARKAGGLTGKENVKRRGRPEA